MKMGVGEFDESYCSLVFQSNFISELGEAKAPTPAYRTPAAEEEGRI